MRSLLIILFFTITTNVSFAQNTTIDQVDKQTYDSFFSKDYKKTIQLGNEAINNNIDYYFLRYRLGVSYYEIKNYVEAIPHLEKAKEMQNTDPVLLEYLYYSYLFSYNNTKAELLAETFSSELKEKVNYKPTLFKSISLEAGLLSNPKFDSNKNIRGTNQMARGTFYSDVIFGNLLITNSFSPKFKLQNSFNYVSNTSNEIIQGFKNDIFTNNNNYFQWNIIGSYSFNQWKINAGFGLYNASSFSYQLPTSFISNAPISSTKTTTTYFSGSASISKRFKNIEPAISFSYSNLSNFNTITAEAFATYYPFGNINFYGNTKIGLVSFNSNNNTIFTQLIGVKVFKKIWLEGFYSTGNNQNYVSDNGLSTFNTPDNINWYTGSNLNFFFKKFDLSFTYAFQERASGYFVTQSPTVTNTLNYTYNYNLFKTKIVWNF